MASNIVPTAELIERAAAAGLSVKDLDAEWEDVTSMFKEASQSLSSGQIICGDNFSLQEAMSAIELMDPKMDIGLGSSKVQSLQEALKNGRLPAVETLHPSNWLFIMDKLIVAENLHYSGDNLAQCLLTCYYIQDIPNLLKQVPLLFSFAAVLMRRCYYIRECFVESKNYDEEDFIHYDFGMDIGNSWDDDQITAQIEHQITLISSKLNSSAPHFTTKTQVSEEFASLSKTIIDSIEDTELLSAFLTRLNWNRSMFLAQKAFSMPSNSGLSLARQYLEESQNYLMAIAESSSLAAEPSKDKYTLFEYEIMRKLTNSSPPRFSEWEPVSNTITQYKTIVEQLIDITKVTEVYRTMGEAKFALAELGDQKACLVVRSRFLSVAFSDNKLFGKTSIEDCLLYQATQQFAINPKHATADEKTLNFHLGLIVTGVQDYFRALGHTKTRRRRRLAHIFNHWTTLLYDGDVLDSKINALLRHNNDSERSRSFLRWHLDIIQGMISEYLQLGFEIDLYEIHEMPMIWWYLDNLAASSHQNLTYVLKYNEYMKLRALDAKKRGKQPHRDIKDIQFTPTWYTLELEAKFLLTRSIFRYLAALDWAGYLPEPKIKLGSTRTRYFTRFRALLNLSHPQPLRFEQYQTTYIDAIEKKEVNGAVLLAIANDSIKKAQATLKQLINFKPTDTASNMPPAHILKEAQKLLRVAVTNGVHILMLTTSKKLATKTSDPKSHIVNLDFGSHKNFPIITLSQKQ